jgi:hypothetical protein
MKRDFELIRDVLLAIEAHDGSPFMKLEFPGFPRNRFTIILDCLWMRGS